MKTKATKRQENILNFPNGMKIYMPIGITGKKEYYRGVQKLRVKEDV